MSPPPNPNSSPLRVLAMLPVYEATPTGAFVTSREYMQALADRGHTVHVVTTIREPGQPRLVNGVQVWPLTYWRRALHTLRPELLISHHGDRRSALIRQVAARIPHLLMVHGMSADRHLGNPDLAWFPTEACRAHYPRYRGRSLVLPPPINPDRYRTTPGGMVTLNGSTAAKGADILARVADRLPDMRFLAVRTPTRRHAVQLDLPNVTVIDRTDPVDVYARTRVLLMPSTTESYGRAGVEAMCSGIPVLASPLPGMREAFGDAAVYIPRADVDQWVDELRRLSDPVVYARVSTKARAYADRLDYTANLDLFEDACRAVAHRPQTAVARSVRPRVRLA